MAQGLMTTTAGTVDGVANATSTPGTFAYSRRLLDRLVNSFVFYGLGEDKKLEANSGSSITFRRYNNLAAATTPLGEGVTPAGSSISKADITCSVYQYGDYVTYTDWIDMVGVDGNVVKIIDELQADQVSDTFDQLTRDLLAAGTNVRYANNDGTPTRAEVNSALATTDLDYVINYFERNNVKHLREKTLPGVQVATQGLLPGYIAFAHPDLRSTFEGFTTDWVPVSKYPAGAKILPYEAGTWKQLKVIFTTNAPVWLASGATGNGTYRNVAGGSTADDVYGIICIGKGAFGNVKLTKGAVKMIVKPLGYKDPLDQEGSVGWKGAYGGLILDQTRVVRIECLCAVIAA